MTWDIWISYMGTALFLTMLPGIDTAVVLRTSAREGAGQGVLAACGIGLGCLCWGMMAAFGLSAFLSTWPLALGVLRLAGAGYIGWLGANLLWRSGAGVVGKDDLSRPAGNASMAFQRGLVTNLLNPKVGAFYLTLIPQFAPLGSATILTSLQLAAIHVGLAFIWFSIIAHLAGTLAACLRKEHVTTAVDRVTGGVLIVLGAGLILNH